MVWEQQWLSQVQHLKAVTTHRVAGHIVRKGALPLDRPLYIFPAAEFLPSVPHY